MSRTHDAVDVEQTLGRFVLQCPVQAFVVLDEAGIVLAATRAARALLHGRADLGENFVARVELRAFVQTMRDEGRAVCRLDDHGERGRRPLVLTGEAIDGRFVVHLSEIADAECEPGPRSLPRAEVHGLSTLGALRDEPGSTAAVTLGHRDLAGGRHDAGTPEHSGVERDDAAGVGHRATVLVVERDPGLRAEVSRVLGGGGYHVLAAAAGLEALRAAASSPRGVDLVLTDVVLEDMSARTLVGQLARCHGHRPRVVLMSGHPRELLADYGVSDPEHVLLRKPFADAALLRAMGEALGSGRDAQPSASRRGDS